MNEAVRPVPQSPIPARFVKPEERRVSMDLIASDRILCRCDCGALPQGGDSVFEGLPGKLRLFHFCSEFLRPQRQRRSCTKRGLKFPAATIRPLPGGTPFFLSCQSQRQIDACFGEILPPLVAQCESVFSFGLGILAAA